MTMSEAIDNSKNAFQVEKALKLLLTTEGVRSYLIRHDPKALEQALAALDASDPGWDSKLHDRIRKELRSAKLAPVETDMERYEELRDRMREAREAIKRLDFGTASDLLDQADTDFILFAHSMGIYVGEH